MSTCPMCGGSSHPATGCAYSAGFVVCWRCTREAAETVTQFSEMYSKSVETPEAFDELYEAFDRLLLRGAFFHANLGCLAALRASPPLPLKLLVGILTTTLVWRRFLPARAEVAKRAMAVAREEHGIERANRILKGLV